MVDDISIRLQRSTERMKMLSHIISIAAPFILVSLTVCKQPFQKGFLLTYCFALWRNASLVDKLLDMLRLKLTITRNKRTNAKRKINCFGEYFGNDKSFDTNLSLNTY